jgi:hypothetical protein
MGVCDHNNQALMLERAAEDCVDQAQAAQKRGEHDIYEVFLILAGQYLEQATVHRLACLEES